MSLPKVIYLPDLQSLDELLSCENSEFITKITLGKLPEDYKMPEKAAGKLEALPELSDKFPKLTHLYLWNIKNLQKLTHLPKNLECLEVRYCPDLEEITHLPPTLDTLVIHHNPKLNRLDFKQKYENFENLFDISFDSNPELNPSCLDEIFQEGAAPKLVYLTYQNCQRLNRVKQWPNKLVDIRFNSCRELANLPKSWPEGLRRLELEYCGNLKTIYDFEYECPKLDYVNLAHTRHLEMLPKFSKVHFPRTLFLHGAEFKIPPASLHGEEKNKGQYENVSSQVKKYFEEVDLVGPGKVHRCKVLFLGNGSAGKTCLALSLHSKLDPHKDYPGSTHGIQFLNDSIEVEVDGHIEDVDLHYWDFGGQEIYHNTHRLFVSIGSVFIIVWDMMRDKEPTEECPHSPLDVKRSLAYWIDYIRQAMPLTPKIAVVANLNTSTGNINLEAIEESFKQWTSYSNFPEIKLFNVDCKSNISEDHDLFKWVKRSVGEVVSRQGTRVPSYWEIAQKTVQSWIDSNPEKTQKQMSFKEFHKEMDRAIQKDKGNYNKLAEAIKSKQFTLRQDRVCDILEFLTHGGWVYWNEHLFEKQIIIGQEWALQGIYSLLDRDDKSKIYKKLKVSKGVFTLENLQNWNENETLKPHISLFLSYMEQCQLCFRYLEERESWNKQNVYISYEHLPTAQKENFQERFNQFSQGNDISSSSIEYPCIHDFHWVKILHEAALEYGKNAEYACDGLLIVNAESQMILITYYLEPEGLKGTITIQVCGANHLERFESIKKYINNIVYFQKHLPGNNSRTANREHMGEKMEKITVFISYKRKTENHQDLEEPANAINEFLCQIPGVTTYFDAKDHKEMQSLMDFLNKAATSSHFLAIFSEEYWSSVYCMYELTSAYNSIVKYRKDVFNNIIPVHHHSCRIRDQNGRNQYHDTWDKKKGDLGSKFGKYTMEDLKTDAKYVINRYSDILDDTTSLTLDWPSKKSNLLETIQQRILSARSSKEPVLSNPHQT